MSELTSSIHLLSAVELHQHFMEGKLSATEIIQHFLDRIHRYDAQIGAFLAVYEKEALEQAHLLDEKRLKKEYLGPLAGVPIALKDNIHLLGKPTTCASNFLKEHFDAPFDATVTHLLQEADAIIIGKTNLDEFAMGSSTENSALQKTHNPWDLKCSPGGSSGGSAAAVAARLVPIALGSDTGGSIRQPASFCGTMGYKPTYGRVSRFGLVAFGSSLDQIGPLANTVDDIALIMHVIGRYDPQDSTSLEDTRSAPVSYPLPKLSYSGLRIGVPYNFIKNLEAHSKAVFEKNLQKIEAAGAQLVNINLDLLNYSIAVYYILATAEASTNLARFDGIRYGHRSMQAHTLNDVYMQSKEEGFGSEVKRRILLGTFVLSAGYQDAYYKKAQKIRTLMLRQAEEAFKQCDLIVLPTTPTAAFEMGSKKDPLQMYLEDLYTIGANLLGTPALSIPCGWSPENRPLGLQFMGAQGSDTLLLKAAKTFEALNQKEMHAVQLPAWVRST